jgi:anti-anti-sigma factor
MTLEITIEKLAEATEIKLNGDIDAQTIRDIQKTVAPLLLKQPANIIFDCTGLQYINSRGVALLVQTHRQSMVNRGKLILVKAGDRLVRALDLAKVSDTLLFCDSREEAVVGFD